MIRYFKTGGLMIMAALLFAGCKTTSESPFVKVTNGQFTLQDSAYYFMGTNYWYGGVLGLTPQGKERLVKELDFLKENNITILRVLAAAEGHGPIHGKMTVEPAYQSAPGIFHDEVLEGLDFLLSEMGKRDMKAVLYLSNNWEWSGGFLQYLNWAGILPDSIMRKPIAWDDYRDWVSKFYSSDSCKNMYQRQLERIVSRTNTINGTHYHDDPAIFAWQLANEPRPMRSEAVPDFVKWVADMSSLIKELDPNHMVSTGCEGALPIEGMTVYESVHRLPTVDYATIHIWPKNWSWFSDTSLHKGMDSVIIKSNTYINEHIAAATSLHKPLVIEEFGMPRDLHVYKPGTPVTGRDIYYASVIEHWKKSVQEKGIVGGFSFWAYGGIGKADPGSDFYVKGADLMGDPPQEEQGLNAVFNSDSTTWKLLNKTYSEAFQKK